MQSIEEFISDLVESGGTSLHWSVGALYGDDAPLKYNLDAQKSLIHHSRAIPGLPTSLAQSNGFYCVSGGMSRNSYSLNYDPNVIAVYSRLEQKLFFVIRFLPNNTMQQLWVG